MYDSDSDDPDTSDDFDPLGDSYVTYTLTTRMHNAVDYSDTIRALAADNPIPTPRTYAQATTSVDSHTRGD